MPRSSDRPGMGETRKHTMRPEDADEQSPSRTTRERVKIIAGDLYVLHGFNGFSFGDIAIAVGTTRANIHHHFGNKNNLLNELISDFVEDAAARISSHWTDGEVSFVRRLHLQLADLKEFHARYNPKPGDRNVWSPLSRLRLDLPILGTLASEALERTNHVYHETLTKAVQRAIAARELRSDTPVDDVARIIRLTILSCPPMTQDTGSFDELDRLFGSLERTVIAAWGRLPGNDETGEARWEQH
jgi:AcrR family transcriptional regulator